MGDMGVGIAGAHDARAPEASVPKILETFDLWDVPATVIGKVVRREGQAHVPGVQVFDLDLGSAERAGYCRPIAPPAARGGASGTQLPDGLNSVVYPRSPTQYACKDWVISQYDHEVRASTIIKPLQKAGYRGPADATVLKPLPGSFRGLAIAVASTRGSPR